MVSNDFSIVKAMEHRHFGFGGHFYMMLTERADIMLVY